MKISNTRKNTKGSALRVTNAKFFRVNISGRPRNFSRHYHTTALTLAGVPVSPSATGSLAGGSIGSSVATDQAVGGMLAPNKGNMMFPGNALPRLYAQQILPVDGNPYPIMELPVANMPVEQFALNAMGQ